MIRAGKAGGAVVFAAQHAAGQRKPHDDADVLFLRLRQQLVQQLLPEHVEDDLKRAHVVVLRADQALFHRLDAGTEELDQLFLLHGMQPVEDLATLQQRQRHAMQLQQINAVATQPILRGPDPVAQTGERVAVRISIRGAAVFGGDERTRLARRQPFTQKTLARPVTVYISGVEEIDACFLRSVDDPVDGGFVDGAEIATKLPAAKADFTDGKAGVSQYPGFHLRVSPFLKKSRERHSRRFVASRACRGHGRSVDRVASICGDPPDLLTAAAICRSATSF